MRVLATGVVVNAIAVAHPKAIPGTISPDRTLHEPRKCHRERGIELSRIDLRGDQVDDVGTPAWLVAGDAVGVFGAEPPQNAGSMQEIMDQSVDGNERDPDVEPY